MMETLLRLVAAVAFAVAAIGSAHAQASRTWVSGVGDDVNPCSRTAPCKTFAGAISKTAAGGEINCLDPGGFGAVTITKSITIDCSGTFGSILNAGTNGVVISDLNTATPGTIRVVLRGLSIHASGSLGGVNGIRFTSGRSLVVENVAIQNQRSGHGISFQPAGAAQLSLTNVTITGNGAGSVTGGGILVQPTGAGGSAQVTFRNVRVLDNANIGLLISTSGNSGSGLNVAVEDSQFSGNASGIELLGGAALIEVMVANSVLASNTGFGIRANGLTASARVGNTTITNNGTGVSAVAGAGIRTYGDNRLDANTSPGAFFPTAAIPKT